MEIDSPEIEFLEEPHEYRIRGIGLVYSVTQVITLANGNDDPFASVPARVMRAARARGKRIHAARHYLDEGDLDWKTVPEEDKGYLDSYWQFKAVTGFKPLENEKRVWSRELRLAGTIDIVGMLFNEKCIVDTKTGECLDSTKYQLAGYTILENDYQLGRFGLKLFKNGRMAKLYEYRDYQDFVTFKDWLRRVSK